VNLAAVSGPAGARARRAPWPVRVIRSVRAGHAFVAGYVVLLAAFGVVPVVYGIYFAFTNTDNYFAGLSNFTATARDFRYLPAFEHIAAYLAIWLVALVILVTVLALVLHQLPVRGLSGLVRFLYYIPGALAGVASVLLWLFMLDPTVSPAASLLRLLGYGTFGQVIAPGHLPVMFAMIAFWTGAGGWIVVMYGALNNIPRDIMEAARIDGAGAWRTARYIQIPMLRKWIVYMVILAFAAGAQLFIEPQLVSEASQGVAGRDYSPNQLAYDFAFQNNNVNHAAAISVELLVISLVVAAVFVARSRFFDAN
jgi:multiple sugar transport system permease protein